MKKVFVLFMTAFLLCSCAGNNNTVEEESSNAPETEAAYEPVTEVTAAEPELTVFEEEKITEFENNPCDIEYYSKCEKCGKSYNDIRIVGSEYFDDELIQKRNDELVKIADCKPHNCGDMVSSPPKSGAGYFLPEYTYSRCGLNLWLYMTGDGGDVCFYDPDSCEKLSADTLLGEEWRNYAVSTCPECNISEINPSSFESWPKRAEDDRNVINFQIHCPHYEIIRAGVPVECIPDKYFEVPEGCLVEE